MLVGTTASTTAVVKHRLVPSVMMDINHAILFGLQEELRDLFDAPYSICLVHNAHGPRSLNIERKCRPLLVVTCHEDYIYLDLRWLCDAFRLSYRYERFEGKQYEYCNPHSIDALLNDIVEAVCWASDPQRPPIIP